MNRSKLTNVRRGPAALLATLLLSVLVLGVAAPQAGAVAALYSEVAEEMASEYAEASCRQDKPDCDWGYGSRCRQQGKFQVTCWAIEDYEIEPSEGLRELWQCKRHIRYTAEKRPYFKHKRVVKHRQFLAPWSCEAHHKVRDY
jgi:hypothetical protein